jgi:hypothetical protein
VITKRNLYRGRLNHSFNSVFILLSSSHPLNHAHLIRAAAVQHEQSSQLDAVTVGAVVHVASTVNGIDVVAGAKPGSHTALTRTGIAAPVDKEKGWCLITVRKVPC